MHSPTLLRAGFAALLTALPCHAAINVSGVSDESANAAGSSATVTVAAEAGFSTEALHNDAPFPVGEAVVISSPGYHEIVETKTPDGGGAPVVSTFQFIIRSPGRASTEDGLPTFTPYPVVNDAPSAFAGLEVQLVAPASFPQDMPIPVVAKLRNPADGEVAWLSGDGASANFPGSPMSLLRGWGSLMLPPAEAPGDTSYDLAINGLAASAPITVEESTAWTEKSGAVGADETWPPDSRIDVTATLQIEAGAELTIEAGSVLRFARGAGIVVAPGGVLTITGTTEDPVVFGPASLDRPWGGIWLEEGDAQMHAAGAIFASYGYQYNWFSTHSGFGSHRDEEACILAADGTTLELDDCYLIDGRGQAFHGDGGDITLRRCLIQRATTAGEITRGQLLFDRCAFLNFLDRPNGASNVFLNDAPGFVDGDNDGLYLQPRTGFTHELVKTVIGWTIDDGIDTGGSGGGTTIVRDCWIEANYHEGMSHSGDGRRPESYGTVFFANGQAFECGYDGPDSYMEGSLVVGNMVGARFGDNYDWSYPGTLEVKNSLLLYNSFHDVWGYDWASWNYNFGKMDIGGNKMTNAADLGRHPGASGGENALWDPAADGALLAPFMPVPDSDVGAALLIEKRSDAMANFPADGKFTVRLSTFSSRQVQIGWSLAGKADAGSDSESVLGSGTLVFEPGETVKEFAAPQPDGFALARLALSDPVAAQITGTDAWFIERGTAPPDEILIPLSGDGWSYSAIRAEPSGGWRGLGYTEDAGEWQTGNTAPVGFGNISSSGGNVSIATTLSAAEAGATDDRTKAIYLRREFEVANPAQVRSLAIRLMRDDSAVLYLNGIEIARSNIDSGATPGGAITYDTWSSSTVTGNAEGAINDIAVPSTALAALVPGTNVLAAEVHQADAGSSDLVFDLELAASFNPPGGDRLVISEFASGPYLFWDDATYLLEESGDLADWQDSESQSSPLLLPLEEGAMFYRGRKR